MSEVTKLSVLSVIRLTLATWKKVRELCGDGLWESAKELLDIKSNECMEMYGRSCLFCAYAEGIGQYGVESHGKKFTELMGRGELECQIYPDFCKFCPIADQCWCNRSWFDMHCIRLENEDDEDMDDDELGLQRIDEICEHLKLLYTEFDKAIEADANETARLVDEAKTKVKTEEDHKKQLIKELDCIDYGNRVVMNHSGVLHNRIQFLRDLIEKGA